ncbi:MAG TPA: FAD-dependent monooxygenase [Magnetospirillum sp.]|nr:FAD-dependent monooxygenase [Magnetospirillum sp.]
MEKFDAIVVGAGPSGNSAAYVMAKAGLKVLQVERGEYSGSKNVQGAILYATSLEKIIPDFRDEAPLERHIVEQRLWMLDDKSHCGTHYRSDAFNEERPNRYTIVRAQFDKWFNGKVREAGALVVCETTVTELARDASGKVVGIKTDRDDETVYADVVVLADGVNSLVGQHSGIRSEIKPEHAALAVKEMHFLPREVIDQRFNIKDNEGVVIEALGTVTMGLMGTAFLYTNGESISVGIGCLVSDFRDSGTSPYVMLDKFKSHPSIAPLLQGSEVKEYAAHLIPEGGYKAIPKVHGDGWLIVGDSGQFVNSLHREGSNLAMETGRMAAETVIALKTEGKAPTEANLARYRKTLEDSFVMKDLKKYKHLPEILHENRQFVTTYPNLLSKAAETWFRVDGLPKLDKEKDIFRTFRSGRTLRGLIGDAVKIARAWR